MPGWRTGCASGGKKVASVAGIGVVALVVFGATCWKTILAEYQHYRLGIHLTVERTGAPAKFLLIIENRSAEERRIWEMWNSWGWWSMSVFLKEQGDGNVEILRRKDQEWTRNFPSFHKILPGQELRLPIDLRDGSWILPDGLAFVKKAHFIKARLEIAPTPEAEKYGVVVGRFESPWN